CVLELCYYCSNDLKKNRLKEKMSRKGNKQTEAVELRVGSELVGSKGVYIVKEFLGEGGFGKVAKCSKLWRGFGKVARCTKLGSPEIYAIKIITNVQEGKEEFESMKLIQVLDPDENHLMKMYECFSFQNVICLVYEILEESLEDFLIKNECKATPLTYVRALAQQMFQALKALKSIGVVHCDIKLDNIMFADKKSLKFKLIDFGLAVESKELPIGTDIQVTRFRAPEVILGLPLDESVDMWALGMVLSPVCSLYSQFSFSELNLILCGGGAFSQMATRTRLTLGDGGYDDIISAPNSSCCWRCLSPLSSDVPNFGRAV
uniref:Protein kinase domain-containing protein n=1 Tax=Oryzias latipes TaxID=8090 RepID=A0A3B3H7L4_ORYLA